MPLKSLNISSLCVLFILMGVGHAYGQSQSQTDTQIISVDKGWAKNSINTVIFRKNSITTHDSTQYLSYYDPQGDIIVAKRLLGEVEWTKQKTQLKADVKDAHNSISIAVDGNGMLHLSWGMHGNKLNYAHSTEPGSLTFISKSEMTGNNEDAVTYPRFYSLSNGDLLFMYRQGSSGSGDIMLNRYNADLKKWNVVSHPLISGEGERNPYVNSLAVDENNGWHLSWTWRETWDVATNHDIMYANSPDEGETWRRSNDKKYSLPITTENAEVAFKIPQGSELINQTSMTINSGGEPAIATYWRSASDKAPQYNLVWSDDGEWKSQQVGNRSLDFSLSGGGTKRIPISRPQIIAGEKGNLYLIFRDFERGGGISIAQSAGKDYNSWNIVDIYADSVGMWEPTYDANAWKKYGQLFLFVQKVGQGDGETLTDTEAQEISVLKWIPQH